MVNTILGRLFLTRPPLTRGRVWSAYAVAIVTDLLQLALGPFGWTFADEVMDVIAMILITRTLGFHVALLPTFAIEVLPLVDFLPTWTGCVALVVALRRRTDFTPVPPSGPIIDI